MVLAKVKKAAKGKAKKSATAAPASAQQKQKQNAEAKRDAMQAIRENPAFKGFGAQQIFSVEIGGKSLFNLILEAKLAKIQNLPTAPKFGAPYYRGLASMYRGDGGGAVAARAAGEKPQEIREKLVNALIDWNDSPRNSGPLLEFLALSTEVLFLFVFKWFLKF